MRPRSLVLSALAVTQLKRLAHFCRVKASGRKSDLVATIAKQRGTPLATLLSCLKRDEIKTLTEALDLVPSGDTKDEMIAAITGNRRHALRAKILKSLRRQGFQLRGDRISLPDAIDKNRVRALHVEAVEHKRAKAECTLSRKEPDLIKWIANGNDVDPLVMKPVLVEVLPDSIEEIVFRYASLHWAIPVSSGYGRRLRYVVIDESNGKLIGLIGLGDPVFALAPRDNWVGWTSPQRRAGLHHILDAFVLGAVPPYSQLLCGKLVAMLAASRDVTSRFQAKYGGKEAVISGKNRTGEVALLTTTSALGRSSIYNRLKFHDEPMFVPVGFTRGSGEFQFLNGLYEEMSAYATAELTPTAKSDLWGSGFRNRREVVKKCIHAAGLHQDLLYHGVQREVFVVPTASNSAAYLRGESATLDFHDWRSELLIEWFRDRWLLKRAQTRPEYKTFSRLEYQLWTQETTPK